MTSLLVLVLLLIVAFILGLYTRLARRQDLHEERLARLENGGPLPPPLLTHVPPQRAGDATAVLPVVPIESPRLDERYLP